MHCRSRSSFLIAVCLITTILCLHSLVGAACSCAAPADPAAALEESSAVFAGRVVALEIFPSPNVEPTASFIVEDLIATIVVSQQWKRVSDDEESDLALPFAIRIRTAFTCCVCGFPFQLGETYLVYASSEEDNLTTNACTRTKLLTLATEDLLSLGDPLWTATTEVEDARDGTGDGS